MTGMGAGSRPDAQIAASCPYCGEPKDRHEYASRTSCVLGAPKPPAAHVHRFTDEEVAAMLKRGACMCGIEDAERYPNDHGRFVVPTSPGEQPKADQLGIEEVA